MRLVHATTLAVHDFQGSEDVPDFAILSHTWGEEECTLQMMDHPKLVLRQGYRKIKLTCAQALRDGIQWAWIDTCCIDKSSTAELSEAINSMFRWYRDAKVCYAYLSDVEDVSALPESRWFTRGWTLQELIAPRNMRFYDSEWRCVGTKSELATILSQTCKIDEFVLTTGKYQHIQVATKMSWAAKRRTTRIEDQSYCLLGIFGVNMPLLYGEGKKAFARLQEEIMKTADDQSLFAWGLTDNPRTLQQYLEEWAPTDILDMHGLFADSPSDFLLSNRIKVLENPHTGMPPIVSNNGVRIELQNLQLKDENTQFAALFCTMIGRFDCYLGFPLKRWGHRWTTRIKELLLIPARDLAIGDKPYRPPSICLIKPPVDLYTSPVPRTMMKIIRRTLAFKEFYELEEIVCSPHATYSSDDQTIALTTDLNTLHAAMIYSPNRNKEHYLSMVAPEVATVFRRSETCHFLPCGIEIYSNEPVQGKHRLVKNRPPCFKVLQPSFAILVGGTLNTPWVDCVTVLNDVGDSAEFHSLLQVDQKESLVKSCTTRSDLLKQLKQPLSFPARQKVDTSRKIQAVAYCRSYTGLRKLPGNYAELTALQENHIFVDARLRLVSSNLVERSLFLSVDFSWSKESLSKTEDAKWWEH